MPTTVAPLVEACGIGKRLGATVALRDVSITVRAGQTHGLVGRNGAGKSTLVGILTGLRAPDTGTIAFQGEPAPPLGDRAAWRRRVACVYQHASIVPALSVAENLFINRQPGRAGWIDWRETRSRARALLDRWQVPVAETARAGGLSVEHRQLVEIARALSHGARLIILDEPTALLDGTAIQRLFARMRELQRDGVTFLFISHHLQEVYDICQTVTVLRDGRHIVTAPVRYLGRERLIEAMTGDRGALAVPDAAARPAPPPGAPVLAVEELAGESFAALSFGVAGGEVLGLAGSDSSGCIEAGGCIAGLRRPHAGAVRVRGAAVPRGDVAAALARGIGCVPRERHHEGLVLPRGIADNATMTDHRLGRWGFVAPSRRRSRAAHMITTLDIVAAGPDQPVARLSGGNQQKVVLARALATDPAVLVLISPTAGVDVKSKESLLASVERERARGKAVLLVSGELDDLRMCDRILVMFRGRIVAEHRAGWADATLTADMEGMARHAA